MSTVAKNTSHTRACPDCLSADLSWLLAQAHFALASELRRAFEPLGVSARGYHVLTAAALGEHTQKELADQVGLDKTTMVVTVDELEKAGLAERRPSPTDRRARVIAVTPAGKRKIAEGQKTVQRVQTDVLGTLPEDEREVFLGTLEGLVADRLAVPVECSPPLRRRA
ncbi:MAG: MarR family transcriptional regulator, transcriptional regulator for hemolysin [Thermoleophilales bacterium]|jgi:DNA-binding MarR family transcriptional regulator|nr:MarR family transcriptional regulator, transcriptional regulator for hemolysin [Thermoleophilales bacterium]